MTAKAGRNRERESAHSPIILELVLVEDLLLFCALEVIHLFANRLLPESEGRVP